MIIKDPLLRGYSIRQQGPHKYAVFRGETMLTGKVFDEPNRAVYEIIERICSEETGEFTLEQGTMFREQMLQEISECLSIEGIQKKYMRLAQQAKTEKKEDVKINETPVVQEENEVK